MKIEDYKIIREEIKKEYEQNNEMISELTWKANILNSNRLTDKAGDVLKLGSLTLLILSCCSVFIGNLNIIPYEYVSLFNVGVSSLIGVVGQQIFYKTAKLKDKLHSFSKAKKGIELLEEKTKNEIEIAKLENKNEILKKIYQFSESNINSLDVINERYNVFEKEKDKRTLNEINAEIETINSLLEEELKNLDISTTRKFLSHKFWEIRVKLMIVNNPIMFGMFGISVGIMTMLLGAMPDLIYIMKFAESYGYNALEANYLNAVAFLIVGTTITTISIVKSNRDNKKIFKKINGELGSNKILNHSTKKEFEELDISLEKATNNVYNARLQLKTEKRALINYTNPTNDNNQEQTLVIKANNCDKDFQFDKEKIVTVEIEPQQEDTGIKLIKKIKTDNPFN